MLIGLGRSNHIAAAMEIQDGGALYCILRSAPPSWHAADGCSFVDDSRRGRYFLHHLVEGFAGIWPADGPLRGPEYQAHRHHGGAVKQVFRVMHRRHMVVFG